MNERLRGRKVTRPSLLAVIGSMRQQTSLCWKRWQRGVVGRFAVLWWQFDCGNRRNQWSEHEDTAPEVNQRFSGDLSTSATLKVSMFFNVNSDTGGRRPRKEVASEGRCQHITTLSVVFSSVFCLSVHFDLARCASIFRVAPHLTTHLLVGQVRLSKRQARIYAPT